MMFTASQQNRPAFIRYPRGAGEGVPVKEQPKLLEIGKAEVVQDFNSGRGHKVTFFALGNMQKTARKAADALAAEGFNCAIVNPRFTKPIDEEMTARYGSQSEVVVTLEDHVLMGGYGSTVVEFFNDRRLLVPVVRIGWPDQFIEHASSVDYLRQKYGLTAENAVAQVKAQFNAAPMGSVNDAETRQSDERFGRRPV
jgi:1-deoxy-D-xylulose-5-phosphate synthase